MTPDAERRIKEIVARATGGQLSLQMNESDIEVFVREAYAQATEDAAKIAEKMNMHYNGFTGTVYSGNVEQAIRQHRSKT